MEIRPDRVRQLFHDALECEPHERSAFLACACDGDAPLREQVESLLSAFIEHQNFLQSPVFNLSAADVAARVLAENEESSIIGQLIGPYRLIRRIGHGGMGAVYLAERADGHYDQQVAIKIIKRGMDSEELVRRFRRERQILANLVHAHISRLLDGGITSDGRPYFVMEYVEGQRIDEYASTRQLPTTERLNIFLAVCAAVQYAHQHNVIHRDIKPGNILVKADGTPKLVDFGIAKLLDGGSPGDSTVETATALRLLTPEYASPEQLRGMPLGAASDVYSLGVVLYELLTGHRPYILKSRAPTEILETVMKTEPQKPSTAISSREPSSLSGEATSAKASSEVMSRSRDDRLSKLRRELRGDLDNIVLMALRKEPERRYLSVEEFAQDIRRHLDGRPVNARKDILGRWSSRLLKRPRRAAIIAVVLSVVLGVASPKIPSLRSAYTALFARPHTSRDSIAVIPFANGVDPKVENISDEITNGLIDRLSKLPGLTLAKHDSVSKFKGQTVDPKAVGKELGVATVLTGCVTFDGENLLIDAELFDSSNGRKLWGKQYSGKTLNIPAICEDMLKQLSVTMSSK